MEEQHLISFVFSNIPWSIIFVTYILIFLDLFYGVLVSFILKEPESHKMLKGLQRKTFVLFVPLFGLIIKSFFVLTELPSEWSGTETVTGILGVASVADFPVCFLLCLFIMIMEIYSMLESSAKLDGRAQKLLAFFNKKTKQEIEKGNVVSKFYQKNEE